MNDIALVKSQLKLQAWAEMVRECQQSELTVEAWCKSRNLNTKTYYYRLKKVREAALTGMPHDQICAADEHSAPCFKKLEVQSPGMSMTPAVVVRLPYATLEVSSDASQRTLEAVLLALKSTC